MKMERSGWAAAVGLTYKIRDGRTVKITEYRAYFAEPGSSAAAYRAAGVNEYIEGHTESTLPVTIEWNPAGECTRIEGTAVAQYAQFDLIESIRAGKR